MTKLGRNFSMTDNQDAIVKVLQGSTSPALMAHQLEQFHENDIAAVLPLLSAAQRKKLLRVLNPETLSTVFSYVDEPAPLLEALDIRKAVDIVSGMEADDAVDVLRQLSKEKRDALLDIMPAEQKKDILLVASYDEDEIGSYMTTDFIQVPLNDTAEAAMAALSEQAKDTDNISTLYVLALDGTFFGALPLRDLLIAPKTSTVQDLCQTSYPYVYGREQLDDCMETLKDYSEDSIPVLDAQNRVLGIVTAQDLIEVSDQEMGEDYAKLAGLTAENDLKESVLQSTRKRLPWLIILLALGLVVSSVVGIFEGVVAQLPLIICFQSLVLDMAGNVGTQSLAVTIRVLTDETIPVRTRLRLIPRETKVGLLNGTLLGILSFACIGLYLLAAKGQTIHMSFAISGCIGIALVVAMAASALFGTVIPMCFKKIGIDPAVASGPLITTVNDLIAVVVYYGLTWIFLIEIFHLV